MSATVAAGLLANLASNAMADVKAAAANEEDRKNMFLQDMINRRNNVLAYSDQVQGAKMAGLSPAMLNGATPTVAAPVTKPNAHQAENVEIDPATLLLRAQKDNLDAQTEKTEAETDKIKGVDTDNVKADTDLKVANTLLTGAEKGLTEAKTRTEGFRPNQVWSESEKTYADTEKTRAETGKVKVDARRISQLNEQYTDTNKALKKIGPSVAKSIMNSDAYANFDENTKVYFRKVADGSLPLSVGALDAVTSLVNANDNIRSKDKEATSYQLAKDVLHEQIADSGVRSAIAKLPKQTAEKLDAEITKFENEIVSIAVRTTSENQDVMLKEIEKKAKALQFAIDNIQPEAWASRGEDWEYFKSLFRHFTEHPSELLLPLGIFKGATGLTIEKKSGAPKNPPHVHFNPKHGSYGETFGNPNWVPPMEPDVGVQSMKKKRR